MAVDSVVDDLESVKRKLIGDGFLRSLPSLALALFLALPRWVTR